MPRMPRKAIQVHLARARRYSCCRYKRHRTSSGCNGTGTPNRLERSAGRDKHQRSASSQRLCVGGQQQ